MQTLDKQQRHQLNVVRNLSKQAGELYRRFCEVCPKEYQDERVVDHESQSHHWYDTFQDVFGAMEELSWLEIKLGPQPEDIEGDDF